MFYIRQISGVHSPYTPGALRQSRAVDSIRGVNPLSAHSERPTAADATGESTATETQHAIAAYTRTLQQESPRRRVLFAAEMMSKNVVTLPETALLSEAQTLFTTRRFRHIPVHDPAGYITGMLSDRDLLRHAAQSRATSKTPTDWENEPVRSIMTQPVLLATSDTEVRELARIMFDERVGCIPIIDEAQQLLGIITRSDILRTLLVQAPLELWR